MPTSLPPPASHDVYLSYSSHDRAAIEAVSDGLARAGISTWVAPRDVPPGVDYATAIIDPIRRCRVAVVVVSAHAAASARVLREVERVVAGRKPIIPLLIDDVKLSDEWQYLISPVHCIDARGTDWQKHIPVLIDAVRRHLVPLNEGQVAASPGDLLAREVTASYPAPIALAYGRFCQEGDPPMQMQGLFYTLEATLRYLVTLGLSDLLSCLALTGDPNARVPDHRAFDLLRRERGGFLSGQWAETLRETARALSQQPHAFVPDLPAGCRPGGPFEEPVGWLVRQRNEWAHPTGGPLSPDECRRGVEEARPHVEALLRHIRFVCDYPLGFVTSPAPDLSRAAEQHWRLHSGMGTQVGKLIPGEETGALERLADGLPFVVAPGDSRLLYLWPLMTQRTSPERLRPTLYFFESVRAGRRDLFMTRIRSFAIDAREVWEQELHSEPALDHAWLFARLRDLQAASAAPAGLGAALRRSQPAVETVAGKPPATAVAPPPRPRPTTADEEAFSSQTVVTRFPAPVAIAYRRFCQEQAPTDRLLKLFACVEALTRYLVTLGVSDLFQCLARGGRPDAGLPDHKAFLFLKRPQNMQLGMWVEALRETARALAGQPGVLSELPEAAAADGRLLKLLNELVKKRNKCVHRGGSLSIGAGECAKVLPALRPKLDEALRLIRFTCGYPLGFAQRSLGQPGEAGRHRYYFHSCMGARVADTDQAHVAEVPLGLAEDVPFVVTPDGTRLLYLWPLLLQRVAGLTGRHTLYAFEGLPEDGWPFLTKIDAAAIDVEDSWQVALAKEPSASLAWLLERLRRLPAVVDLPAELELAEELLPTRRGGLVGRQLTADLRLEAALATGGFGTIYAARTALGKQLAVKVLEVQGVKGELKRFQQEFDKLLSAGGHPGIVRCYERGIAMIGKREYPWYSMELALGDLTCRIDERLRAGEDRLPWDEPAHRRAVLHEFQAVLDAVAHLHALDIVHRDIKPGNVLVTEDGLRLSDFGLVKNLSPSERSLELVPKSSAGGVKGTRVYMAPEQERGERVDKAADVYALGVLLAELATGRRPEPQTLVPRGSTLHQSRLVRRLPEALRELILQCTDVDADERPRDAGALRERFGAVRERVESGQSFV